MRAEQRNPGKFSIVELVGYGDVYVEQAADPGAPAGLTVEADESIISRVGSETWGNRLRLGMIMPWYEWFSFFWTWIFAHKSVTFRLTVPSVEGLEITGSGNVNAEGMRLERCTLVLRGSGALRFRGEVKGALSSLITGSGTIECRGSAASHEIRISGAGSVNAAECDAGSASVRITGSGGVTVRARDELDVSITGSGGVTYRGEPKLQSRITGSGRVARAG